MKTNKNLLNQALTSFLKRLEKTEKFVLEQSPDICKQMIREVQIKNKFDAIFGSILFLIGLILIAVSFCGGVTDTKDNPTKYAFYLIFGLVPAFFGSLMIYEASRVLIYLKNCPKLFLLREFKKLVNGENE